jgi:hypothetical protein
LDTGAFLERELAVEKLISVLQRDSQKTGRAVYVTPLQAHNSYLRLSVEQTPLRIQESLRALRFASREGGLPSNPFFYRDRRGVHPVKSALFITDSHTKIAAAKNIFGNQPKGRFCGVNIADPDYHIFPLPKRDWVDRGGSI